MEKIQKKILIEGGVALLLTGVLLVQIYRSDGTMERHHFNTAQALHLKAKQALEEGDYREAERITREALAVDPKFAKSYIDLGNIRAEQGDYRSAEKAFLTALQHIGKDEPNREVILFDLGGMYEREGDAEKSWKYFTEALKIRSHLGPEMWVDQPGHVTYYVLHGDRQGFVRFLGERKGIPGEVLKRIQTAQQAVDENRLLEALADSARFLHQNPGSAYRYLFHELRVTVFTRMGWYSDSLQELEALRDSPRPPDHEYWIKQMIAWNLLGLEDPAPAVELLYDVVRNSPDAGMREQCQGLLMRALAQLSVQKIRDKIETE